MYFERYLFMNIELVNNVNVTFESKDSNYTDNGQGIFFLTKMWFIRTHWTVNISDYI